MPKTSCAPPIAAGPSSGQALSRHEQACEVSIVIPCLNEAETLETVLRKANHAIAHHQLNAEIIVADNGSADRSACIAADCGARVIHADTPGYGAALQAGIAAARGRFIIMGDADNSYDFSQIHEFYAQWRQGYDLVMGCRLPQGGGTVMPGAMPWLHRWIGNPALSALGRVLFSSAVTDFHCGLRGFSRDLYDRLHVRSTGMEFASELVITATLLDARITEIPIVLHKDGRSRPPHLRTWRDGWRHLRFMLLYSPRWLFLFPGLAVFILGAVLLTGLSLTPLPLAYIPFTTHLLVLSSLLTILGFTLVILSMVAKTVAMTARLLPPDTLTEIFWKYFSLEIGIGLGGLFCLLGLSLLGEDTVGRWYQHSAPFTTPDGQWLAAPAATLTILGIEIMFSSFLFHLLRLSRK